MSTPTPMAGFGATRLPLSSTSVRNAPSPRRLTFAEPVDWPAPNWLESPNTPCADGNALISSVIVGEPCFCRSSEVRTSMGSAASSAAPRMKEPVTMMVSSSDLAVSCANAAE
jgi:hypothetical protein